MDFHSLFISCVRSLDNLEHSGGGNAAVGFSLYTESIVLAGCVAGAIWRDVAYFLQLYGTGFWRSTVDHLVYRIVVVTVFMDGCCTAKSGYILFGHAYPGPTLWFGRWQFCLQYGEY